MKYVRGQITIISIDSAIIMNITPPIIPILCSKIGSWADDPESDGDFSDSVFIDNDVEVSFEVSLKTDNEI